ncbi:MAG: glycerol kinase GlpK [Firmicutes bacterium]|nr:glycerol kinase GlpK [Bacillota bacterium]
MSEKYILGLDQGTTGSTAIVFDSQGRVVAKAYQELTQSYPKPGWVEHDADEIWRITLEVARRALAQLPEGPESVAGLGITNQRETTVVWDRTTGRPICPAVVWQCRRTAQAIEKLKSSEKAKTIQEKTGLVLDAYFSASKLQWILDNVPKAREKAAGGELCFGTVDSWLIWNLTGGKVHVTDYSNASRTMLFNIHTLSWDQELLEIFDVPMSMLPEVRSSSEVYGFTQPGLLGTTQIPIGGAVGDQQAATFGQACFHPGRAKITYGTGGFLLLPIGSRPTFSEHGLLTTIAWGLNGQVEYALEGSIFSAGSTIQWLRDGLQILDSATQSEELATKVADTGGVYMVPAFTGLGAPYWDMYARGTIIGITRGTTREHLVRAALESIAFQARDVLEAMQSDSGVSLNNIRVDGGAAANNFLMQFQADILGLPVDRPHTVETTALGAAYLAGLATGFWENLDQIETNWGKDRTFHPLMSSKEREALYSGWRRAVERSLNWEERL